jgi:hypothetical protein
MLNPKPYKPYKPYMVHSYSYGPYIACRIRRRTAIAIHRTLPQRGSFQHAHFECNSITVQDCWNTLDDKFLAPIDKLVPMELLKIEDSIKSLM